MTLQQTLALAIFVLTMVLIMSDKIHHTAAAVLGAVLMILTRVLDFDKAVSYIDFGTIGMLIGMMLFVAVVKNSGIFEYLAIKSAKLVKGRPWRIMIAFVVITAALSAFLDNVTTVLLVGPMTLAITNMLDINPVPYMMAEVLASNAGGTATLIGDPPNIMIGTAANLNFMDFISNTGVDVVLVIAAFLVIFYFIYGKNMKVDEAHIQKVLKLDENLAVKDKSLLRKSVVMIVLVVAGFIFHAQLGIDSAMVAFAAAAVMMIIGRQDVEETVADVEWTTILFFIGLFIVVGGLKEAGIIDLVAKAIVRFTGGNLIVTMILILWLSAILSSFMDNIAFVATLIPMITAIGTSLHTDVTCLWWALSLGACLGGNGSIIGASCNVVLTGISGKNGYPISFKDFFKVGFPMMLISVGISTVYLLIKFA